MGFTTEDTERVENNKQHLNLSYFAYEIVMDDMFAFGEERLSGFLNTIFEYYSPLAEASIARNIECMSGELDELFMDVLGDEETKKLVKRKLLMKKKSELKTKASSYEKGKAFKFWLNKKNLEYLTEKDSECNEEAFYSRRGEYIKAVIEEYTRLPYAERELIYFSPRVEIIKNAIKNNWQLRVVTGKNTLYSVFPYEIFQDPLSTTNYLVGYSKRYGIEDDEKKACSFKISALKSVRVEKSKSGFLKEREKIKLAEKLSLCGVQFMLGDEIEVHVKLTENGRYKYRRQMHLRPAIAEQKDDNIFVFNCTMAQAEFYFFKFGKDAEIILPLELRHRFQMMYNEAANNYLTEGEDGIHGV